MKKKTKQSQIKRTLKIGKTQGTIIRSKEMTIINEGTPNKYFYLQEQQKQAKKHIKQL